jgi:hypothetical protein
MMISTFSVKQAITALWCWVQYVDYEAIKREILHEIRTTDEVDEISLLYMELALLHTMKPQHTLRGLYATQQGVDERLDRRSVPTLPENFA